MRPRRRRSPPWRKRQAAKPPSRQKSKAWPYRRRGPARRSLHLLAALAAWRLGDLSARERRVPLKLQRAYHPRKPAPLPGGRTLTGERFEPSDAKFESSDAKFESRDAKFESRDAKFEPSDAKFEPSDAKLESSDAKFDVPDAKLESSLRGRRKIPTKSQIEHAKSEMENTKSETKDVK